MQLPEIEIIKPNFTRIDMQLGLADCTIWFSYKTPIAFMVNGKLTIRQNDWSVTTGKHLNQISKDKSERVSAEVFQERWDNLHKN